jgi:integrase
MKMYKGHRYVISCKALGVPETKEASYQAANAWWIAKQVELDAASRPVPRTLLPLEDLVAALHGRADLSDRRGLIQIARDQEERQAASMSQQTAAALSDSLFDSADADPKADQGASRIPLAQLIDMVEEWRRTGSLYTKAAEEGPLPEADVVRRAVILEELRTFFPPHVLNGEALPTQLLNTLAPARAQLLEGGLKAIRGEYATEAERTVATHADLWLKSQQAKVDAGQMSAARCANNRTCLEHFKVYLGPQADVGGIDAQKLQGFYQHCLTKITARQRKDAEGWSVAYARDVFSVGKAFVKWLVEQGTVDPPRNIGSKSFKFGSPAKTVQTWTVEEFEAAVAAATGKLKVALLLMANCGMTQEDISELKDTEVDWAGGRIIRKRSKTADHENVPTVNYPLWPRTFQLLKQNRSGSELVLLTENNEAFVRTRLKEDGRLSKADGFASNYVHLKKKLRRSLPGFDRPLKELRKLGASLLASHSEYGRFQSYFLGHSPRTVADRHYVVPPQKLFDKAVLWLGKQLGQVE